MPFNRQEMNALIMNVPSQVSLLPTNDVLKKAWENISHKLHALYGDAVFRSWLKPLRFVDCANNVAKIGVPTRFMREWISTHYIKDIQRLWQEEKGTGDLLFEIIIQQSPAVSVQDNTPIGYGQLQAEPRPENDVHMGAPLDPRYTFDNFVVGKPNELAHAAARRIAEASEVVQGCNPLFLYGGVGLGKTHLMHAIAWHIRHTHPKRRVMYLSAEKFMYQFIKALRFKEAFAFKEQFRSVDVLIDRRCTIYQW